MTKALLGLIPLVLLAGCVMGDSQAVIAARQTCTTAYADPALNPVRDKIPLSEADAVKASMSLLADGSHPSDAERPALQRYDIANRQCWDAWDRAAVPSPIIQQARATENSALAELYTGQINYGEFNRRRANALGQMQSQLQQQNAINRAAARPSPMFCDEVGRRPFVTLNCF